MKTRVVCALVATLLLAACGGGSAGSPVPVPTGPVVAGHASPGPAPQGCTSYTSFGQPVAKVSQPLPDAQYSVDYVTTVQSGTDNLVEWQVPAGQCTSDAIGFALAVTGGNGQTVSNYYGYQPVGVSLYFVRPTASPQPTLAVIEQKNSAYPHSSGSVVYQSTLTSGYVMWAIQAPGPGPWNVYAHFFNATLVPAYGTQSDCPGGSCTFTTSYDTIAAPFTDTLDSATPYQRVTTTLPEVTPSP